MQEDSALERLSPELQQQILLQLDTLESLHALILASPRFFQVFRINKGITLSTIVRRQLPPAATLDAPTIEKVIQLGQPPFSRRFLLDLFKSTPKEQREWQSSILPLAISMKLCRLDKTIQFFINDYAQNTLPILYQLRASEDIDIRMEYGQNSHGSLPELSDDELKRLRRGFCRFETYRQLFARCSSDFNHDLQHCSRRIPFSVFEQGQMFFQHTPAYQVAEVACIRDYLVRRLRGVFEQVEDEAVKALKAEFPNPKNKEQAMEWDDNTGGRYGYFDLDEGHYFTYDGKYKQNYHIEHLLSLGLPYIRRILESTEHERRDLLLRHEVSCSVQRETDFLTAALGLDLMAPPSEYYGAIERGLNSCLDDKSESDLPTAWRWAHADGSYLGLVDRRWKGLRDWGYVFWSSERVQDSGILDRDPYDMREIEFDEYQASLGPSVQERWMGPQEDVTDSDYDDDYSEFNETQDQEAEKVEEVEEVEECEESGRIKGGHEEGEGNAELMEDKGASHKLVSRLSLAGKFLWDAGIAHLKSWNTLGVDSRQQSSKALSNKP